MKQKIYITLSGLCFASMIAAASSTGIDSAYFLWLAIQIIVSAFGFVWFAYKADTCTT